MKDILPLLLIAAILIILLFYFVTAKGEKKKIQIITAGGTIDLNVEIADNFVTRAKGLMGRKSLGANDGMLFVFDKEEKHFFWMVNTTIPLDAIHISKNGAVVDIIEMDPCKKCSSYPTDAESLYVLEVNQGFSKENKIEINKSKLILNNIS